ncbi:MAG: tRNA (adenosine(37)-N6)-threonylcarbamoyltransferase complex dimerization subunit type 1 TsaB [Caulobacteraceae bacterium]
MPIPLTVLALDASLGACSVAVADDDGLNVAMSEPMTRGHQERLAPMAAEVMARAGLGFPVLDRIGVTLGPGSFTGVRVGLAFAKGLSVALAVPCIGVGSLEALAASVRPGLVAAVIDARHDQLYVQAFDDGAPLAPPQVLSRPAAIAWAKVVFGSLRPAFVGPGAGTFADHFEGAEVVILAGPDPRAVARLAQSAAALDVRPRPIYLRPPDARTLAERNA